MHGIELAASEEIDSDQLRVLSNYLIPQFGDRKIAELSTMEFQEFFSSLLGDLSPYTICNMYAALRAALSQAKSWDLINRNTVMGVKLRRKTFEADPVAYVPADLGRTRASSRTHEGHRHPHRLRIYAHGRSAGASLEQYPRKPDRDRRAIV